MRTPRYSLEHDELVLIPPIPRAVQRQQQQIMKNVKLAILGVVLLLVRIASLLMGFGSQGLTMCCVASCWQLLGYIIAAIVCGGLWFQGCTK